MSTSRFHWADYLVTVAMLLISLSIGFFFALFKGGQKTKVEYLLGNREMSLGPVCLSLFVTFQSAISLIGTPADTYNTGAMVMYLNVGIAIAYIVGCFTVVPVMYPLHLTSIYQYLDMRFKSATVRLLGTCIGMLQTILYMGVALFSPALALQAAAGLPLWVSLAIVGGTGTLYTAVGGIKSVVWTDAFQTIIVFIGMATVLIKGLKTVGGFSSMVDIAYRGDRMIFAELNPDPRERHSIWGCLIGGCVMWLTNCFNQSSVQRIGSLKTLKAARIGFLLNFPLNVIYGTTLMLTGLLLYAYVITIGCDPYNAGLINNRNQMMPYFVIHVLDDLPGFAGLYMSMLFSGALSTLSSGINALAANSVEDILARPLRRFKDTTVTIIAKLLVVVYGVLTIGLAYGMKALEGPVTQLATTAFGACGGPVVGIFMLGGAVTRANKYGALCGGLIGLAINIWLAIGSRLYGKPIVTLPPGPTHNCYLENTSLALNTSDAPFVHGFLEEYSTGNSLSSSTSALVEEGLNRTEVFAEEPFSIYDISYMWLGVIGLVTSFVCGTIVSFVTGGNDVDALDSRLIFPFCRKLYGLPEPIQRPEDISNVIAMKTYREAWDTFKKRNIPMEIITEALEDSGHDLPNLTLTEDKQPENLIFLQRNGIDSE